MPRRDGYTAFTDPKPTKRVIRARATKREALIARSMQGHSDVPSWATKLANSRLGRHLPPI